MGKGGDAIDGLARRKTEQERAVAGELAGRRERDYVDVGLARHRLDRLDLGGKQRPENQLGPAGDRRAGGAGCPFRRPFGVARQEGEMLIGDVEQRELRRVEHGTADPGTRPAQRQQQRDLHLGAGRRGRRAGRSGQDRLRLGRSSDRRGALQGCRRGRYPIGATADGDRQSDGKQNGAGRRNGAAQVEAAAEQGTGHA